MYLFSQTINNLITNSYSNKWTHFPPKMISFNSIICYDDLFSGSTLMMSPNHRIFLRDVGLFVTFPPV